MNAMIKVTGLTGGIGTGKSTAAEYFVKKGFAHIDADEISRDLTADGSSLLPVLDELFGPEGRWGDGNTEILDGDGNLLRKALAAVVFSDEERRKKLDQVMFQKIIERIDDEISLLRRKSGIDGRLLYAPLLFEAGLDTRCDAVLVLVADEEVRISRVCARDGMTPEEVRDRIRNQMSDNEKIKRADAVIDNSDGIQELKENIDEFLDDFLPEIQRHKSTQKNL